ncbi:23S rRNA (uracil(1939)-C(5))-methyltransferase RlmD [Saprospiraceae bacterium]|jgi:23S rRNA (uracil1939-C5)-methyltransferase|nr:23S rRNA (uracil(1939)-C(5))-methyltransferase RlmD [Bacteroidota bacterium]MDB4727569.1 23S rRNA (uracil(1939)-C(5))-methyltransferase RlmD [Saprospiraceae bacterium]MDF1865251.1 23S rRNA (uracil(1939)-C(5))-methyltransferase RlmD [Saprospiraceae bacterium]
MARRKNRVISALDIEITGVADKGKGVGRDEEGRVIFVERVVPGDVVDVRIVKKKKGFFNGFPTNFKKLSEDRIEPLCEHFEVCGGCQYQSLSYETQLKHKSIAVSDALKRIAKVEFEELLPIVPCEEITYYRNKLEFAFSNKRWLTQEEVDAGEISNEEDVLGFHRARAFDKIVDINHCWLQPDPSNDLRIGIKEIAKEQGLPFFDIKKNDGFMRHILIRNTTLGEVMLIVSFFRNDQKKIKAFFDVVLEKFPQLTSIFYCINSKQNDFLLDLEMVNYHGKAFIEEQLGHVRFKIGPKSFFQTNSKQAKILYDKVVEFAELKGTENVYDLYTGIGSIALYVAKNCKQVVGIEEVADAIKDAKENAAMNQTENCVFYAGDVRKILTDEFAEKHGKPDLVITDPPRAGMHNKVVDMFLKLEAPKIVYVSCNPATQARDINLLSEKYDLVKVQPVDMFPHTYHIESVALLKLKKGKE